MGCRETATGSHCARRNSNFRENQILPFFCVKMFRFIFSISPLLLLVAGAPRPQTHAEAPQAFSHDAALAAHAEAERQVAALALLHPANPGVVGDTGAIGASGIVGSSGNIGPSGLCGPSGCVAFGK